MESKTSLRQEIKGKLSKLTLLARKKKSRAILNKLAKLSAYRRAQTVCFFVGMPTEVDTCPMIEHAIAHGKRVLLPRVDLENKALKLYEVRDLKKDVLAGPFGILEPNPKKTKRISPKKADCVLVPGLAFDKKNRRLGRGAGFYDRFLTKLRSDTPKIGLAFSFQIVSQVPHEKHDVTLDRVLTDK